MTLTTGSRDDGRFDELAEEFAEPGIPDRVAADHRSGPDGTRTTSRAETPIHAAVLRRAEGCDVNQTSRSGIPRYRAFPPVATQTREGHLTDDALS
jgi:hypothetical protein